VPPGIQEVRGQDYQHRLHRLALPLYLLPEAGVLGDTPEVATMKHQIAQLQKEVKKLESQVEALIYRVRVMEVEKATKREIDHNRHETRDSLDRVADLLDVPRSKV